MKTFKTLFILEAKRVLNRKTLGLFLLFSLLSLYFIQYGINNYKNIIENKEKFLDIEDMKVKQYINYAQYGAYGFRILFIPSPLSIYFTNSSVIPELTSNVDAGERLNIYNSFKGKNLFAEKSGGFKDFSGILLLLGSLIMLYLGYEALIYKDYFRFICGFVDYKGFFISSVFVRAFMGILFFLLTAAISLLLLEANNIELSYHEYARLSTYMGIFFLTLVFFFALGAAAGSFKSRYAGFVLIIIAWFTFVFLIPGIINAVIARKAENIMSNYNLELEKLKILMNFEKRAVKKTGPPGERTAESEKEMVKSYWDNEVKGVQALEQKLANEMEQNIRHFQRLSILCPSTFYLSTGNEISSRGYENFISFYKYIRVLKEKFIEFFIYQRYYKNFTKVEPFIKDKENLFYAESRLPRGTFIGALLTLLYVSGLVVFSYFRFKKSLEL